MRLLSVLLLALLACSAPEPGDPSIQSMSAYIGDQSFVAAHGRAPTEADDHEARIQTHLLYVERLLRERPSTHLSDTARAARAQSLDDLHAYALARRFPLGESSSGYLPTFIDDDDNRCAVAALIEHSAGLQVARAINRVHRNDFVRDMNHPALLAWAENSGLSPDEIALIQPAYPPRREDIRHRVGLRSESALGDPATQLAHLSGLEARLQRNGQPTGNLRSEMAVDAFVGLANFEELAYRLRVWLGYSSGFRIYNSVINGERRDHWAAGPHQMGVRLGLGVEDARADVGRALLLPLDAYYSFPTSTDTRLALHVGPSFSLWGQRPHGFQSSLQFRWKRLVTALGLEERDLHLGLAYERKAGANFAGLQIGLGSYRDDGWYITE